MNNQKTHSGKRVLGRGLMLGFGIFALVRGQFKLPFGHVVDQPHGRITGLLMVVAAMFSGSMMIIGFIGAAMYGLVNARSGDSIQHM